MLRQGTTFIVLSLLTVPMAALVDAATVPTTDPAHPANLLGDELFTFQFDQDDYSNQFPGSLDDQGPLGAHGRIVNDHDITSGPNGFDLAMRFQGTSAHVRLVDPSALDAITDDYTFTMWFFKEASSSWEYILLTGAPGQHPIGVHTNGDRLKLLQGAPDGSWARYDTGVNLPRGVWTHLAVVARGGLWDVLLDGQVVQTMARPVYGASGPFDWVAIGSHASSCCQSQVFRGSLDEVRLYPRALTADEIGHLKELPYAIPNGPPTAEAGPDIEMPCAPGATPIALDGAGSFDPDGDALTYTWSAPTAEAVDQDGTATATAWFAPGMHEVHLTVTDGEDEATDTMTVTVGQGAPPNVTAVHPAAPGLYTANASLPVAPTNDTILLGPTHLGANATSDSACGGVAAVVFELDDGTRVVDTEAPYGFTYTAAGVGLQYRVLTVTAIDDFGLVSQPVSVNLTVMTAAPRS